MHRHLLLAVFAGWVSFTVCGDESITQDGKPVARIIRTGTLSASEEYAVEELVDYVRRISGATLDVVKCDATNALPSYPGAMRIFIGNATCRAFHPDIALDTLGDEGFVIQTKGSDLVIAGGEQRGTLYGVYSFLEDYGGVRWWSPVDTDIPANPNFRVGKIQRRDVPKLELRDAMYCAWGLGFEGYQWEARNKLNGMSFDALKNPKYDKLGNSFYRHSVGGYAHTQNDLVTSGGVTLEPDMQALLASGKRDPMQPCCTHPKVIEATIKTTLGLYRQDPLAPYVVIAHMDHPENFCTCPRCAAIDAEEGSHSGQFFHLVNRVAEALEKEFPRGRILASAYQWTWKPPAKMKLRGNVTIRLAPIQLNQLCPIAQSQDKANQEIERTFTEWKATGIPISVFTYTANFLHYNAPWPNFDGFLANIDFFVANNAKGIGLQGTHTSPGGEFVALRSWTAAKKLWNPDLDNAMLFKTFIEGYYGPAAASVQEYIEAMHTEVRSKAFTPGILVPLNQGFLPAGVVARLEAIARKAESAVAGKEPYVKRVRQFHMPVWYVLLRRGPGSATWKAVEERVGPLDLAAIAAEFAKVEGDYKMTSMSEDERNSMGAFLKWLERYASLVREKGTHVLAEEAQKSEGVRAFLEAWQVSDCFSRGKDRIADPLASDGWAIRVGSRASFVRHLLGSDDLEAGKKYRIHVRVRSDDVPAGFLVAFDGKQIGVPVEEVTGQYKVYSSKPFKLTPNARRQFVIAQEYSGPPKAGAVLLDCLWFTEEPGQPAVKAGSP